MALSQPLKLRACTSTPATHTPSGPGESSASRSPRPCSTLCCWWSQGSALIPWQRPEHVHAGTMIGVAAAGVVMNGVIALLLWRSGRDVNVRSAFLHEIGDTLSTAAVIAGGWAIMLTGQYWIDSALSFGIGALILWSSLGIVRETLNILLEGTTRGMSLEAVESAM